MAKLSIKAGATSESVEIFVPNSSVITTTGAGLTGLVFNTSGLTCYYSFPRGTSTQVTLATLASPTSAWSSGGFKEIDSTHKPGAYRFDIPNALLAGGNGRYVNIYFQGATNMVPVVVEIELTGTDNQDGIRAGMTALPNVALQSPFYLPPYCPPLRILYESFSENTGGINGSSGEVDGRVLDMPGLATWQQAGLFVQNGRLVDYLGTANSFTGTDGYVSDNYTLSAILNVNVPSQNFTGVVGSIGVMFRFSGASLNNNGWACVIDLATMTLKLGTVAASVFSLVSSAPLQSGTSIFTGDNDHVLRIRVNGTLITALLDEGGINDSNDICGVTANSSTYQGQTYVGMITNVLGEVTIPAGKNFSKISLDTPTPAVLMGPVTTASSGSPIQITSANHGLVTGNIVNVRGVGSGNGGNADRWTVTRVDANNFTLNGSSGGTAGSGGFWIQVISVPPFPWPVSWASYLPAADPLVHRLLTNGDPLLSSFLSGTGYTLGNVLNPFDPPPWYAGVAAFATAILTDTGNASNQVVTITMTATGGTWKITFQGQTTSTLQWNAQPATVQAALQALSTIGSGNVTVTGTAGSSYVLTFVSGLGTETLPNVSLTTSSLTGGTAAAVVTTAGSGNNSDLNTPNSLGSIVPFMLSHLSSPNITVVNNLVGSTLTLMKDTDMLAQDNLQIDLTGQAGVDISGGTAFTLNFDEGKLVITGSYVNVGGVQKGRFQPTAAQTKLLKAGILHNWAATVTLQSPTRTIPLVPGYGVAQVVSRQDGS